METNLKIDFDRLFQDRLTDRQGSGLSIFISIKKELSARALKLEEDLFFHDLAISYQRGDCYLCGDPASLDVLCRNQAGITRNIYQVIKSRHLENGAAMNAVQRVFVLTYQENPSLDSLPEILQNEDKCCFLYIPIALRNRWRLSSECCLLAENLDDIEFYFFMAKRYCLERHIPHQRIGFHRENGGGNTTCDVLEKCIVQDRVPVLCLVDSDRKHGMTKAYPNEPAIGDTLDRVQKTVQRLAGHSAFPPHHLFPLHVHEIENLIPSQLLWKLCQELIPDMRLRLERVVHLQDIKEGEPLLYYDYKEGFPYIKKMPQRAYWKEVLLELGGEPSPMPPQDKPERGTYFPDALFFPPLNNKLLDHTLKIINSSEYDTILKTLQIDDYLKSIWEDVGVQMLTWGYVNEPIRA